MRRNEPGYQQDFASPAIKEIMVLDEVARPISDHGVIGNLSTADLVARDGCIDFLCWPNFDSVSIFAALIDPEHGGAFELAPAIADARRLQMYSRHNVLRTRWLGEHESAEILDLMPVFPLNEDGPPRLIRRARATRGRVKFSLRCWPRSDYTRAMPDASLEDSGVAFRCSADVTLMLSASVPLEAVDQAAVCEFVLDTGQTADFGLQGSRR